MRYFNSVCSVAVRFTIGVGKWDFLDVWKDKDK